MSKPYSLDLRERVVACVEAGDSRREAAERFDVSVSSAIRWAQRFVQFGSAAAKPIGGSTSPLEAHAAWLLELIAKHPDWTLDEIVAAMRRHGIAGSRSAVWRFFERHKITVKKKSLYARRSRSRRTWRGRAGGGCASRVCLIRPDWSSPMRPPFLPTWRGRADAASAVTGARRGNRRTPESCGRRWWPFRRGRSSLRLAPSAPAYPRMKCTSCNGRRLSH
jgi:transposase